jgi:hypothetical protein
MYENRTVQGYQMQKDESQDQTLRWSVAQRLEFIEFRLVWEGRINRADIAERFNLTVQQASADLGLYDKIAPQNMEYLRGQKTFVPSANFAPKFLKDKADRQLLQLAAICAGLVESRDTWFSVLPPMAAVPMPLHQVETKVVLLALEAIRARKAVEISYQSIERPAPIRRTIEPHALGHDGERWHLRAWCARNSDFRDFVLSRIEGISIASLASSDPASDAEWNGYVELVLAPNPGLKDGAKRVVAKEFGMERGRLKMRMRAALAWYTIRHLNLDLDDLPPERQKLVLINREDVHLAIGRAKTAARPPAEAGETPHTTR